MDYNFTAKVEEQFDVIAEGKALWSNIIGDFYKPFHQQVEKTLQVSEKANGERILGNDPNTGKQVSVKIGRYGPLVQLGETSDSDEDEKPKFASLQSGMHLETITLDVALELFKLPREVGEYEDKIITVAIGRFGPYVRHNSKFVSLDKTDDPFTITLERSIELIEAKREKDSNALIKVFEQEPDMKLLNGRWGPYIAFKKNNYKLPKGTIAEELNYEDCLKIIEQAGTTKKIIRKKKKA